MPISSKLRLCPGLQAEAEEGGFEPASPRPGLSPALSAAPGILFRGSSAGPAGPPRISGPASSRTQTWVHRGGRGEGRKVRFQRHEWKGEVRGAWEKGVREARKGLQLTQAQPCPHGSSLSPLTSRGPGLLLFQMLPEG